MELFDGIAKFNALSHPRVFYKIMQSYELDIKEILTRFSTF